MTNNTLNDSEGSPLIINEPQSRGKKAARRFKAFNNRRSYFAFPYAAISIIFVIAPLFFILINAFKGIDGGFSLDAFKMFDDLTLWRTIGTSFLIAFLTTAICLVICYPLALCLNKLKASTGSIIIMIFVLPMWINTLLRLYAIKWLFASFNLVKPGFALTVIGMVYDFLPFMLLPLYTVINNMDKSVIEAAEDLGASPITTLIKVRLPLSLPGIISGIMMVFMPTLSSFAVSTILGGGDVVMFGNLIDDWFGPLSSKSIGSAYSLMLMALIGIAVLIANKLAKGKASLTMGGGIV